MGGGGGYSIDSQQENRLWRPCCYQFPSPLNYLNQQKSKALNSEITLPSKKMLS